DALFLIATVQTIHINFATAKDDYDLKTLNSIDINDLKEALNSFFKSRSNSSLSSMSEAVLQAVTELLLPNNRIPELCLRCGNRVKVHQSSRLKKGIEEQLEYITKCYKSIEKEDECTLMEEFYVLVKKDNKPNLTILNEILLSAKNRLERRD
ncbi:7731_t:CDS:2, partial [Funneliformis mosseae]